MSENEAGPVLACTVGAIPAEKRGAHRALTEGLFGGPGQRREEIADGYVFRFTADSFADVAAFVRNEMKCCPFLRFEIDLSPDEGVMVLRLTGPAGTARFLEAQLGFGRPV
jgi:hypothetical protein